MKALVFAEGNHATRLWETSLPLLKERGVDVEFATLRTRGDIHRNLESLGIKTYSLDSKRAKDYLLKARELAQLVRGENFEVIHACEAIPAFVTGLSAFWGNNARRIFNRQHNVVYGKQRLFSFLASRMSHCIMPVSISSGKAAQQFDRVPERKIHVAYSGIEMLREVHAFEVAELRGKLGIPSEARVISMVARLREEKGHRVLFAACGKIASRLEVPLHVVLAGDGQDEDLIRAAAATHDNFKTHFVGNQSDVALWFSIGDVVAMPSYHEAFGLAAAEAMSCKRPLIASNVGGLAEIIENEISGLLVPPKDAGALAEQILRVLDSPQLALQLGEKARTRIKANFTVDKMVDAWAQIYRACCGI